MAQVRYSNYVSKGKNDIKVLNGAEIGYIVKLSVFTFVRDGSYDDPRESNPCALPYVSAQ